MVEARPPGPRRRTGVVGRLNAEWSELDDDPRTAAICARWAVRPALVGVGSLTEVLTLLRSDPDAALGALLTEVGAGDRLAARVVLQAMLGKVVAMAALDPGASVDDYVAALWCRIIRYPLERRPRSIAANLALDTLKAVHRERPADRTPPAEPDRLKAWAEVRPEALVGGAGKPVRPEPTAVSLLEAAVRARLLDPATTDLLRSVYADGLSGEEAARRHATSPGAVRTRCSRAVRRLAAHADALLEVA